MSNKSPCFECEHVAQNKNLEPCKSCDDPFKFVQALGPTSLSVPVNMTDYVQERNIIKPTRKKYTTWTERDIQFLKDNVDTMDNSQLASVMGRPVRHIESNLSRFGIKRKKVKERVSRKAPEKQTDSRAFPDAYLAQDGTNTFKSLFFLDDSYASGAVVIPAIRGVSRIMKKDSAEGDLFYFSIVVADAVKPVSATFRDEQRAASIRGALLVSIEKYYEGKGLCR